MIPVKPYCQHIRYEAQPLSRLTHGGKFAMPTDIHTGQREEPGRGRTITMGFLVSLARSISFWQNHLEKTH